MTTAALPEEERCSISEEVRLVNLDRASW